MKIRARFMIITLLALFPGVPVHMSGAAETPQTPVGTAPKDLSDDELGKVLEQLQHDYNIFPADAKLRHRLAVTHALIGRRRLEQRQFDEAAASYDRARELEPDNGAFRLGRGIALYGGKHYDDALFELEQARLFDGESATVLFFLGKVYYDTGNLESALEVWKKGLALAPDNADLRALIEKTTREATVEARMGRETSSRFVISYDVATETRLANDVLDILDTAYNRVGSDFEHYPDARIPVILYTRQEFRATADGPEWSGGVYDGKIRLPIRGLREITPQVRAILFHEYTHVVIRELTKGNCPTWLNEGLAMLEERQESAPTALKVAMGAPISLSVLEGSFLSLGPKEAAQAYRQSFTMVDYLVSTYGWHKVREILVNLGKGMKMDEAVSKAFADYSLDYTALIHEVQEHLQED
ncbi:MAG TPA: tetratricopeptide repeat protein [Geobacteraceae bacterium]|nr:tetratricopeptide repeat protein [Geobacteraceae bacterium]